MTHIVLSPCFSHSSVQADDYENMDYGNADYGMYQEPPTDSEPQYFNPAPLPTAANELATHERDAKPEADITEFEFDSEDEVSYLEVHD